MSATTFITLEGCRRHKPYATKREAKWALKDWQSKAGGRRMVPFRCCWCDNWHVGKPQPRPDPVAQSAY